MREKEPNPILTAVQNFICEQHEWVGYAAELLDALKAVGNVAIVAIFTTSLGIQNTVITYISYTVLVNVLEVDTAAFPGSLAGAVQDALLFGR